MPGRDWRRAAPITSDRQAAFQYTRARPSGQYSQGAEPPQPPRCGGWGRVRDVPAGIGQQFRRIGAHSRSIGISAQIRLPHAPGLKRAARNPHAVRRCTAGSVSAVPERRDCHCCRRAPVAWILGAGWRSVAISASHRHDDASPSQRRGRGTGDLPVSDGWQCRRGTPHPAGLTVAAFSDAESGPRLTADPAATPQSSREWR